VCRQGASKPGKPYNKGITVFHAVYRLPAEAGKDANPAP
jgi:hypothetical protein